MGACVHISCVFMMPLSILFHMDFSLFMYVVCECVLEKAQYGNDDNAADNNNGIARDRDREQRKCVRALCVCLCVYKFAKNAKRRKKYIQKSLPIVRSDFYFNSFSFTFFPLLVKKKKCRKLK